MSTPVEIPRLLLTPQEAAAALGIGRSTVYELILRDELASVKIGASRRIPADALATYIASLRDRRA